MAETGGDGGKADGGALSHVGLFAGLEPAALETLEEFTFRRTFAPGEVIVEEGRTGNGLFVVLVGHVEVTKEAPGGGQEVIAELGAGEPFGEMALLGEWKRSASVRAAEETTCLGMDRWVFLAHLRRDPELAMRVIQFLAQRLAQADQKLLQR
ncbi:MAG: cyclic nucleotide-binding domain-containing protein [Chloroflexi bacterium]|nr:cyclic nucleotide-binding domain-containing protein [Chloroflexota bacterium]